MRVVIAGGGIGGLALGIALSNADVDVHVLERTVDLDEQGSGLVLAPNGMKAVDAIDEKLGTAVRGAGWVAEPGQRTPFVTATGRVLSGVALADSGDRFGARPVSLLRRDLRNAMLAAAESTGVRLGRGVALTEFADQGDGVLCTCADGSSVRADVLVGADGIRSTVRRHLLGDGPPRYSGITSLRGRSPLPPEYPYGFIASGRGLQVFASPVGGGEVYWVATANAPEGVWPDLGGVAAHRELIRRLTGWHDPVVTMVADCTDVVLTDIHDRDPVSRWGRGRVTLLGDAVHPMLPTMGQGANMALEDAVVLARHLLGHPDAPATALARYQAERAPRTAKVVRRSRMIGRVGQFANPVLATVRDASMWTMGRLNLADRQNAELFDWRP